MAFSMSGVSTAFSAAASAASTAASAAASTPTLREGGLLPEIGPEGLGFKGLNADKKAQVLPSPWPADAQPPSYASLLSIASAHGIYAAGGPDGVVIGKTQAARDCIYGKEGANNQGVCPPLHTIPGSRPLHVAFAADESCLVVAHQESPDIVAYATAALLAKNSTPAVTLSANAPLRALVPNPEPSQAHYVSLVNQSGHLLIADLQKRQLLQAANGPVLADNVSCVTWSNKGKQLIAGRGDGTAIQLLPDGSVKAHFAKPASVPDHCHLAQVVWLENNVFFFNYTPSSPASSQDALSVQYLVRADKDRTTLDLSKADQDIFYAMIDRLPAHFFAARLRNYAPHLDEVLFLSSSVAPEIAMITKASKPLDPTVHAEDHAYTITKPMDDGRWAALPRSTDGGDDTTPIGMAVDLSDQLSILKPIPSDSDIEDSSFPLPELVALNAEGMLVYWAFVYDDAVRSKQPYPGFDELKHIPKSTSFQTPDKARSLSGPADSARPQTSAPSTKLQSPSVASLPSPAIGKPAEKPVFGTGSGFAQSTPINQESRSSWASTGFGGKSQPQGGAFGQPATFGSPSSLGQGTSKSAFGTPGVLGGGMKPSFGQSGFASGPSFGQTSSPFAAQQTQTSPFAAKPSTTASPFASAGTTSGSGFGSFASQGGFSAANKDNKGQSPFSAFGSGGGFSGAGATTASPFASAGPSPQNPFGQPGGPPAFGKPTPIAGSSPFGQSKGFRLESSFQKDETSKDEDDDRSDTGGGGSSFGFGPGLGSMLGSNSQKPAQASAKTQEMADDDGSATEVETASKTQKTPPTTITQPKSTTTPHVSSLFGTTQQSTTPQTQPKGPLSTGWNFGHMPSTTPKATPAPAKSIFGTQPVDNDTPAAVQKSEPNRPFSFASISNQSSALDKVKSLSSDDESEPVKVPDAPLPPDPFSKPGFQTGDTSTSSLNSKTSREPEDAPLPPDFLPANKTASQSIKTQDSEIPSEFLSDDFEESGEDVTGEVSPVEDRDSSRWNGEDRHGNVETSPESSFGHATDRSPVASPIGGAFTNVKVESSKPPARPLFGEFGGTQGPIFPPPKPQQHSPRSPSPMRKPPRQGMFARSPERSFSAPAQPRSLIAQRRQEHQQSPFAAQAAQIEQQEAEKARLRREAERRAQKAAEAAQFQPLEDDEDALLREELSKPTQPSSNLDPFMAIQPGKALQELDAGQNDVPSQIEVLYQDINSMIVTLGINAKSLSAYIMYQTQQEPNKDWPDVLRSETPMDALNDEWVFGDIERLPEGHAVISSILADVEVHDVMQKLEECQNLLVKEVSDLRNRITALRRSTHARMQSDNNQHAPLSAEQASIQQDLRKASASVLTDLAQVEEKLVILRAKLADLAPSKASSDKQSMFGFMSGTQKRPSVEAVMNTVLKMTSMAEKRSADVDVIEAQLKKLNLARNDGVDAPATPERRISRRAPATPASAGSSVYHTPESNGARSLRSTPARRGRLMVSTEDKEKWQAKAAKKKQISQLLKTILGEENGKARA